jgi:hypothetical protein
MIFLKWYYFEGVPVAKPDAFSGGFLVWLAKAAK